MSTGTVEPPILLHPPEGDHQLVQRVLAGERAAVATFVDRIGPVVTARVRRALRRRRHAAQGRTLEQEVDDLVQEVFAALFEKGGKALRNWQPERGLGLLGFVGLVAERVVASILRNGKRSPWTESPDEDVGEHTPPGEVAPMLRRPDEQLATRSELSSTLEALYAGLSPLGIRMFELLYVEELDVTEVASRMTLSPDAVYAWRSRLRRAARQARAAVDAKPEGTR